MADTKLAMLGLVAAGLGVSVVSRSMACLGRHGVVFRPLIGTRTRLELALATLAAPSPRAATLVALARELASA
ncbi:MAG: LysR substrate-binding domain-containing protein [Myxococcota bacterium]